MYHLPSWLPVLTPLGIRKLEDVRRGEKIWSKDGWTKVVSIGKQTSSSILYKFKTNTGIVFANSNQNVFWEGDITKVCKAQCIDTCKGDIVQPDDDPEFLAKGIMWGSGSWYPEGAVVYPFVNDDLSILDEKNPLLGDKVFNSQSKLFKIKVENDELSMDKGMDKRFLPDNIVTASPCKASSFIKGLVSVNAYFYNINNIFRIAILLDSKRMAEQIQMLLSSVGFNSILITKKAQTLPFQSDISQMRNYKLEISQNAKDFVEEIGFVQPKKQKAAKAKMKLATDDSLITGGLTMDCTTVSSSEVLYAIKVDNLSKSFWSHGCSLVCGE